ncbi:MAG: iron chaperone [Chthoniobacterales bacterium]
MKARKTNSGQVSRRTKTGRPETPDDYLAAVPSDQRAALETLRKRIKAAAPKAKEYISYGIPAFRLNGKLLVAYGAAARHCAFYPGSVVQVLEDELKDYETSKGTIRFPANKPLSAALVRKLVKLRIAKNSNT